MPQESESRALDKVIVRLPDGMRDRLKQAAGENNRSMNAEIVARLEDTLEVDQAGGEQAFMMGELTGKVSGAMGALQVQFKEMQSTVERLRDENNVLQKTIEASISNSTRDEQLNEIVARFEEEAGELPSARTIYVLLDTDGRPTSWQEIYEHLDFIGRASGGGVNKIDARVFAPDVLSSSERDEEWWSLREFYRSEIKKNNSAGKSDEKK